MTRPQVAVAAFDLGGVLVEVDRGALDRQLRAARRSVTASAVEAAFFGGNRHHQLSTGQVSSEDFVQRVATELDVSPAVVETAWAAMVAPREGARALVDALAASDVTVVAWSNTDPLHAASLAPELGALLSAARALSFELGVEKPASTFFSEALRRAASAASAVVYVDDRLENVTAARAMGVRAVQVTSVAEAADVMKAEGLLAA